MSDDTVDRGEVEKRGPGRPRKNFYADLADQAAAQLAALKQPVAASPEPSAKVEVAAAPVKKGNRPWMGADRNHIGFKADGFRYRWVRKDQERIERNMEAGWIPVNRVNGQPSEPVELDPTVYGKVMQNGFVRGDRIAMALPEELAQDRDRWVRGRTEAQTIGLKRTLQNDMAREAPAGTAPAQVHGGITIIR